MANSNNENKLSVLNTTNDNILLFKKHFIFKSDDKTHENFIANSFYGIKDEYEIMLTHLHSQGSFDA